MPLQTIDSPSPGDGASVVSVARAESPEDIEAVRVLIRSFVRWTMSEIANVDNPTVFAGLEAELTGLPGRYGPPTGCLVLARLAGEPVGCGAFYAHDGTTVEIKRIFVLPAARGHAVGRQMIELLLTQARGSGFARALLSSHHSMHAAHAVYRRAGFRDVAVSADFPNAIAGIDVCMELALGPSSSD